MNITPLSSEIVKGKVVVVRLDLNVPVKNGKITESTRIVESIPTLKFLLKNQAKQVHILSHLGRPKGEVDEKYSLKVVVPELEKHLGSRVEFRSKLSASSAPVQLHENIRFYPGEKTNDPDFIQDLLKIGGEIFVNDGFAVSHRAHASVIGLASFLPAYPGFLVQKEIEQMSPYLSNKKVPGLSVVTGGAKLETKIKILQHFAKTADHIFIGGALANTFLAAQGFDMGGSFYEADEIPTAQKVLEIAAKNKTEIHLPTDLVCAEAMNTPKAEIKKVGSLSAKDGAFDIGPATIKSYQAILENAETIIWNGPLGCFEFKPFEAGTREVLKTIAAQKSSETILGGGDTLDALKKFGVAKTAFTHVSTGGGAMLEFLEGKELPGIEVLNS